MEKKEKLRKLKEGAEVAYFDIAEGTGQRIHWIITRMKGIERYRNIELELLSTLSALRSIRESIEVIEKAEKNG